MGYVNLIDVDKVIPDRSLSVREGGIAPLGKMRQTMIFWQIQAVLEKYDCTLDTPLSKVPDEAVDEILNGSTERLRVPASVTQTTNDYFTNFDGLVKYIQQMQDAEMGVAAQKWVEQFSRTAECPACHGLRLNRQALHFRIAGKHIMQVKSSPKCSEIPFDHDLILSNTLNGPLPNATILHIPKAAKT